MTYPNNSNQYLPGVIAIPSALQITSISQSYPMVIGISVNTVVAANTYIAQQLVRLNVPYDYGMFQANGLQGKIITNTGSTLVVDIDSRQFDPFVIPTSGVQPASLAPAGSRNLEYNNNTDLVPFQSLNNQGN